MRAGKVLIGFAVLWLIVWCIVGFVMGVASGAYHQKMTEYAQQGGNLAQFWALQSAWKAHTVAHSHALCFAMVTFLVGLAMAVRAIEYGDLRAVIVLLLITGVITASIADWFGAVPAMVIGGILFILALVVSFVGLFIRPKNQAHNEARTWQ